MSSAYSPAGERCVRDGDIVEHQRGWPGEFAESPGPAAKISVRKLRVAEKELGPCIDQCIDAR